VRDFVAGEAAVHLARKRAAKHQAAPIHQQPGDCLR
jgi:hypothetical protein